MPTSARCLQPGCRFILGLLLVWLYCVVPSLAMEFSGSPFNTDTFSGGQLLRADLERIYRSPKEAGQSLGRGIDVSSIVAQYIRIGTSFDDAERILKAAGFTMAPRPPRPIDRDPASDWENALRFALAGGLDLDHTFLVSRTSVSVVLAPDDPNAHVKDSRLDQDNLSLDGKKRNSENEKDQELSRRVAGFSSFRSLRILYNNGFAHGIDVESPGDC